MALSRWAYSRENVRLGKRPFELLPEVATLRQPSWEGVDEGTAAPDLRRHGPACPRQDLNDRGLAHR